MHPAHHDKPHSLRGTSVAAMLRWYSPYVRGHRALLGGIGAATVVMLTGQAVVPLIIEHMLGLARWNAPVVGLLLTVVVIQIVASHAAHLGAGLLVSQSSHKLRQRVFDRTLDSDVFHQRGLVRSSIVSRHSSDVDAIGEAVEQTIVSGVPGMIRVVIALSLLTVIEWRAGVAMAAATVLFLVYRRHIGRRLLVVDRNQLHSRSRMSAAVDEAISGSRLIAGLHLGPWQRRRFGALSSNLQVATRQQSTSVAQLYSAANLTGLTGLVTVIVLALAVGGESLAGVAAAILYVESVVRGLEALPPWLRSVQLAVVSQIRIDEILDLGNRTHSPDATDDPDDAAGPEGDTRDGLVISDLHLTFDSGFRLTGADLHLDPGGVVGVVTPIGSEPDDLFSLLAGDGNPDSGRVLLGGRDVRMPGVRGSIAYVPADAIAFDVPILEQLRAVDPLLTPTDALAVLDKVGLAHLADLSGGLSAASGHGGAMLNLGERQRLAVATAVISQPRLLLVGPVLALAEPDGALELLSMLRGTAIETVVVAVDSPEVAAEVDRMVFVSEGSLHQGTHTDLLRSHPDYAHLWQRRLVPGDVDLSVIGIPEGSQAALLTRLVTEHYGPGETIYRQGDLADRIVFTISGQVEITTDDGTGVPRRVAVLGPGNHCGDQRLTAGQVRAESARAIDDCVVRSLSRSAINAGMAGLLDRTPVERRIMTRALRTGPFTRSDLARDADGLAHLSDVEIDGALALLIRDGALRLDNDTFEVVHRKKKRSGASDILDRLGGL